MSNDLKPKHYYQPLPKDMLGLDTPESLGLSFEALPGDKIVDTEKKNFDYPENIPPSAEVIDEHEKRSKQNAETVKLDAQFEVFMRTDSLAKGKISD